MHFHFSNFLCVSKFRRNQLFLFLKGVFYVEAFLCKSILCRMFAFFSTKADFDMDTRHIFPQDVLVTITFIGDVIGIVGSKTVQNVFHGCCPMGARSSSLVVIEVLRFGFDQALFPLNACPASRREMLKRLEPMSSHRAKASPGSINGSA